MEIWKKINERYEVSNHGKVRSIDAESIDNRGRKKFRKGKLLSLKGTINGYPVVNISNSKDRRTWKVHQLVAINFIPNPDNMPVINHKNGIKTDNRADNLEWCTQSYNCQHAYDVLKRDCARNYGFNNGFSRVVLDINTGVFYGSVSEVATLYKIKRTTLTAQLSGQNPNQTQFKYV